jgi:hypothetical protein
MDWVSTVCSARRLLGFSFVSEAAVFSRPGSQELLIELVGKPRNGFARIVAEDIDGADHFVVVVADGKDVGER